MAMSHFPAALRWLRTWWPGPLVALLAIGGGVTIALATTGALTQKAGTAGCIAEVATTDCTDGWGLDDPVSVTVSPDNTSVYVTSNTSDAVTVFDRNTTTGALTQQVRATGCISDLWVFHTCVDGWGLDGASAVTVSPDNANVYVASQISDAVTVFDRSPIPTPTALPGAQRCTAGPKTRTCTTTGSSPARAATITQRATTATTTTFAIDTVKARVKTATGNCRIITFAAAPRAYTCTLVLSVGSWTTTTEAVNTRGLVIARSVRRQTVRAH